MAVGLNCSLLPFFLGRSSSLAASEERPLGCWFKRQVVTPTTLHNGLAHAPRGNPSEFKWPWTTGTDSRKKPTNGELIMLTSTL